MHNTETRVESIAWRKLGPAALCGLLVGLGASFCLGEEVSLASDNGSRPRLVAADGAPGYVTFDEDAQVETSREPVSLVGTWSGRWYSCSTGHQGPLYAQFCRLSCGDYQVNFRGRFFRVFPFRYSVVLRVMEEKDGTVFLRGESYLGRLFGTFHYEATATGCEFRADYRSCKDRGTFWLTKDCH